MAKRKRQKKSNTKTAEVVHSDQPPSAPPNAKSAWLDWQPWTVFVTALILRLGYWLLYLRSPLHGDYVVDQAYYHDWAKRIANGEILSEHVFEQAPLYPYALGVVLAMLGDKIAIVLLLQLLLGTVSVLLVYFVGRRIFDRATATSAGLLAAAFGPLIFYDVMVMKSFLSPLLTMWALWAGVCYQQKERTHFLIQLGTAIGLACLIRENHLLLLLASLAAIWVWRKPKEGVRVTMKKMGLVTSMVVLCLLPSAIHNWVVAKEVVLVTAGGGEVLYMGHGPDATGYYHAPDFVRPHPLTEHEDFRNEAQRRSGKQLTRSESSRYWAGEAITAIGKHPFRELWLIGRKTIILLNNLEIGDSEDYRVGKTVIPLLALLPTFGWISAFGLLGAALSVRRLYKAANDPHLLLVGFAFAHILSIWATYNFGRFRLGLVPLWCLFAGLAISWLRKRWGQSDLGGRQKLTLVGSCLLVATLFSFRSPPGADEMTYGVDVEQHLARLALRRGEYDLADRHYIQALEEMQKHERETKQELDGNQTALLAKKIGDKWIKTDQPGRSVQYYRAAIQSPNKPAHREELLQAWVSALRHFKRHKISTPDVPPDELSRVLAELRTLRSDSLPYWAISAWHPGDTSLETIEEGIKQTEWNTTGEFDEESGWRWFGKAGLAKQRGETELARLAAERALQAWPEHPWREELLTLTE